MVYIVCNRQKRSINRSVEKLVIKLNKIDWDFWVKLNSVKKTSPIDLPVAHLWFDTHVRVDQPSSSRVFLKSNFFPSFPERNDSISYFLYCPTVSGAFSKLNKTLNMQPCQFFYWAKFYYYEKKSFADSETQIFTGRNKILQA